MFSYRKPMMSKGILFRSKTAFGKNRKNQKSPVLPSPVSAPVAVPNQTAHVSHMSPENHHPSSLLVIGEQLYYILVRPM